MGVRRRRGGDCQRPSGEFGPFWAGGSVRIVSPSWTDRTALQGEGSSTRRVDYKMIQAYFVESFTARLCIYSANGKRSRSEDFKNPSIGQELLRASCFRHRFAQKHSCFLGTPRRQYEKANRPPAKFSHLMWAGSWDRVADWYWEPTWARVSFGRASSLECGGGVYEVPGAAVWNRTELKYSGNLRQPGVCH